MHINLELMQTKQLIFFGAFLYDFAELK